MKAKAQTKVVDKVKSSKSQKFDPNLDYKNLNLRENPQLYKIGRGEQGVFAIQPYKDELLPLWRISTIAAATESSNKIYEKFVLYRDGKDFVGTDLARKYLQMGFTRSRRYVNHKGGKKYEEIDGKKVELPKLKEEHQDREKVRAAKIFKDVLDKVNGDRLYIELMEEHINCN